MAVFPIIPPWQLGKDTRFQQTRTVWGGTLGVPRCGEEFEDGLVAAKDGRPLERARCHLACHTAVASGHDPHNDRHHQEEKSQLRCDWTSKQQQAVFGLFRHVHRVSLTSFWFRSFSSHATVRPVSTQKWKCGEFSPSIECGAQTGCRQ